MKIDISAYTLVNNSPFAKQFTDCALDSIAEYLEGLFCDIIAPGSIADDVLLDATEQAPQDVLEEYGYPDLDTLKKEMEDYGHYYALLENGNVLIIE